MIVYMNKAFIHTIIIQT